jgi:CBS domain containing-hemolysin-like protein
MLELALLICAIIIFSGIFSGTEAAILSVTPSEVEMMIQKKKRFSRALEMVTKKTNRSVTTVLILNNIVNIAGSILVGRQTVIIFGSPALGIMTTAFTFGIIIFSEIIPKSLATRYARRISRYASPPILLVTWLFMPFIYPIEVLVRSIGKGERTIGTEDQIRSLVRLGRRKGHIEQDEGQLIHRVFNLNDVTAKDIMIPREQISALSLETSLNKAAEIIIADSHSRFPVHGDSMDDIRGIILETEILGRCVEGKEEPTLEHHMHPALYVDESTKADDLLIFFRDEKTHMAIVRRKGKKTVGLVTLEDVLEELVGEIEDERDTKAEISPAPRSA